MAGSPIQQRLLLAISLIAIGFLTAQAPRGLAEENKSPASPLNGSWKLISVEVNGESRPLDDDVRWTIKGNNVLYGGEQLATVTSYPAAAPKGIDLALVEPNALY